MSLGSGKGWITPKRDKHTIMLDKKTGKPRAPGARMAAGQLKNAHGKASRLAKRWKAKSK
jgi:hypothetical protein